MVILSEISINTHFIKMSLSNRQRFLYIKSLNIAKPAWNNKNNSNCGKII